VQALCDSGGIDEVASTQDTHDVGVDVTNLHHLKQGCYKHIYPEIKSFLSLLYSEQLQVGFSNLRANVGCHTCFMVFPTF